MKYTNRLCCMLFAGVFLLGGCGAKEYSLPYTMNSSVSSFRLDTDEEYRPNTFAQDLCISSVDVTEGTTVDMSEAGAAGLFDLNNKEVLYAKNIHEKMYPASLTKIMTALIALKYGNPEDLITVTSNVKIDESGAQLCNLKEGDTLTLDQALHALLMYSANDAGIAIAEHVGGSIEGFTEMMNEEAVRLGATNSHFVNPHGLHDESHYTTVYDLYLMFNEVMKYDKFNEIIRMTSYQTVYNDRSGNAKEFDFGTTNLFLKGTYTAPENITVLGGKTGTTSSAGGCLILLSKNAAGSPYISVILKAKDRGILYTDMTELLDEINK